MPPRGKPAKAPVSASRDLVTTGPKDVFAKHHKTRRDENGNKPTTARALVLRNGKHGAMGTGEVMLLNKMSGREKLDLLAGKPFLKLWMNIFSSLHCNDHHDRGLC